MCGRAAYLQRHVLARFVARADLRVEMVDSDEVHVPKVLEEVAFTARGQAQMLLE